MVKVPTGFLNGLPEKKTAARRRKSRLKILKDARATEKLLKKKQMKDDIIGEYQLMIKQKRLDLAKISSPSKRKREEEKMDEEEV